MEIEIWRYNSDLFSTVGFLMERTELTRRKLCYTVEDAWQRVKIPGKTRIPAGRYEIKFRRGSPMAARYALQFPGHRGMLWLQGVPGFEFVYLHIGNDEDDTDGCPLLGLHVNEDARAVQQSRAAYREVYPVLADAVGAPGGLWLTVLDLDRPAMPMPG